MNHERTAQAALRRLNAFHEESTGNNLGALREAVRMTWRAANIEPTTPVEPSTVDGAKGAVGVLLDEIEQARFLREHALSAEARGDAAWELRSLLVQRDLMEAIISMGV